MQTMNLTFSPSALHDLTISWSSGVLSSSDGEFHFVENRPDTCEGVWKVTANWTSALEMPVFSFRISLEAYAISCKSFFVESPFVRKIRKVEACDREGHVIAEVSFTQGTFRNLWENGRQISYYKVTF